MMNLKPLLLIAFTILTICSCSKSSDDDTTTDPDPTTSTVTMTLTSKVVGDFDDTSVINYNDASNTLITVPLTADWSKEIITPDDYKLVFNVSGYSDGGVNIQLKADATDGLEKSNSLIFSFSNSFTLSIYNE